jgi:hypothetical protein
MRSGFVLVVVIAACNKPPPAPPSPTPTPEPVQIASAAPSAAASASASAAASADAPEDAGVDAGSFALLTNDHFGFSCEYPDFFLKQPADGDGRGQSLYTKDRKATMRCWAMYSHQPAQELYDDWVRRPGLTEKRLDGNTWVVAGREDNMDFYSKSVLADGLITTVEMHWDPSLGSTYTPLAHHATDSLQLLPLGVRLKNREKR